MPEGPLQLTTAGGRVEDVETGVEDNGGATEWSTETWALDAEEPVTHCVHDPVQLPVPHEPTDTGTLPTTQVKDRVTQVPLLRITLQTAGLVQANGSPEDDAPDVPAEELDTHRTVPSWQL